MADHEEVDYGVWEEEPASVQDHGEDDEDDCGDLLVPIDSLKLEDKRLDGFLRSKVATLRDGHRVQLQVSAAFGGAHRGERGDAVCDRIRDADYVDADLFRLKGAWNFVLTAVGTPGAFDDVHYTGQDAVLDNMLNNFAMGYFREPLSLARDERSAADHNDLDKSVGDDVGSSPRCDSSFGDLLSFSSLDPSPLLHARAASARPLTEDDDSEGSGCLLYTSPSPRDGW